MAVATPTPTHVAAGGRAARDARDLREHRRAATAAGTLYLLGTLAGLLSQAVSGPVRGATDPLAGAATHSGAIVTSAVLVLVMGLSLALIPIVLFPVLRRLDEVLAIGYLIVRGALETICYVAIAIGWLLLEPLHKVMSGSPDGAPARLGKLVIDSDAVNVVLAILFCLGATMFYVVLYRSRIVPRWIAAWGLLAIPLYVAAWVLPAYGTIGTGSTVQSVLFVPLGLQEIVLAVWMIARGFRPAET